MNELLEEGIAILYFKILGHLRPLLQILNFRNFFSLGIISGVKDSFCGSLRVLCSCSKSRKNQQEEHKQYTFLTRESERLVSKFRGEK